MRMAVATASVALLLAGCGKTPIEPTVQAATSVKVLTGHLDVGGQLLLLFQVLDAAAPVRLTLASVTNSAGETIAPTLKMQAGGPTETGCGSEKERVNTPPGLVAQLPLFLQPGTYCVEVDDTGVLTDGVDVALRVTVNPLPNASSAGTDTFSSNVTIDGAAARNFLAKQPGDVTVTLTSLAAPDAMLGIGIDAAEGCKLYKAVRATPGTAPQLTASVDQGFYCVKIFNVTNPKVETPFSISITHP